MLGDFENRLEVISEGSSYPSLLTANQVARNNERVQYECSKKVFLAHITI